MSEELKNIKKVQKLSEGAIKELLLTADDSNRTKSVKYDEIYVVTSEFYEKNVKGKEEKVTEVLKCKAIAVLCSAKAEDRISFVHRTKFESDAKKIELEGIKYTALYTLPLGCGIYVWGIDKPNNPWIMNDNKSFKICNYEGQYLQLVYYEDSRYGYAECTEYLLLKTCQKKNMIRI